MAALTGVALLLAHLAAVPGARADVPSVPPTTVVHPTGRFPDDVRNVQAALDRGGTVLLRATSATGAPAAFDFGPATAGSGAVTIRRDAELVGERVGGAATTIAGGHAPVRGFAAITAAVRDIAFEGPLSFALFFVQPPEADVEITGNRFSHVVGRFFEPLGFTTAAAVVAGGGRLTIADNVVSDVDADFGQGIAEGDASGPVEILRNRISGTSGYGIEATQLDVPSQGAVRIAENVLEPGSNSGGFPGSGIAVNGTGEYTVARNDMRIEVPWGVGISVVGAPGFGLGPVVAPVITHNRVVLDPARVDGSLFNDGIQLAGHVSRAYVGQNTIQGAGLSALIAFRVLDGQPSDLGANTFVGNDIARMRAAHADVVLDEATHDTVLTGRSGIVDDRGRDNRITGFTKGRHPMSGRQVSEAVRLRNLRVRYAAEVRQDGEVPP